MEKANIRDVMLIQSECRLGYWSAADYLRELNRDDSIALTAKEKEKVIGFLTARLIKTLNYQKSSHIANSRLESENSRAENAENIAKENASQREKTNEDENENVYENEAEIYNIGVSPIYQRRGIGGSLFKEFLNSAKRMRIKIIWLETRETNQRAIEFYRRRGFQKAYTRKNFYAHPSENALVMKSEL